MSQTAKKAGQLYSTAKQTARAYPTGWKGLPIKVVFIQARKVVKTAPTDRLEAEPLNDTDKMELRVYSNAALNQALLVARLDNLGKGASGAAVQNIRLMLGLDKA